MLPPGLYTGYPLPEPPPVPRTPAAKASLHLPLSLEEQFLTDIPTLDGRSVSRSTSALTPRTHVKGKTIFMAPDSLPAAPLISKAAPADEIQDLSDMGNADQVFWDAVDPRKLFRRGQTSRAKSASKIKTESCSDPAETSIFRRRSSWRKKETSPISTALSMNPLEVPQGLTASAISSSNDSISLRLHVAQRTERWVDQNSRIAGIVRGAAAASAAANTIPNRRLPFPYSQDFSSSSTQRFYPITDDRSSSQISFPPNRHMVHPFYWNAPSANSPTRRLNMERNRFNPRSLTTSAGLTSIPEYSVEVSSPSRFVSTSSDPAPYPPAVFTATRNQQNFSPAPFAAHAPTRLTPAVPARQISQRSKSRPTTPMPSVQTAHSVTSSISILSMTVGPPTPTPRPEIAVVEAHPPSPQERRPRFQRLVARFFSAITTVMKPGGRRQE